MCGCYVVWFISICYFCFFNQKTAYEMRISDWSSDVCSSDLGGWNWRRPVSISCRTGRSWTWRDGRRSTSSRICEGLNPCRYRPISNATRSEEHTSELQSLMRISYAVFCLKKQKAHTQETMDKLVMTPTEHKLQHTKND